MDRKLRKKPGQASIRRSEALSGRVQDGVIDKLHSEHIERLLEYEDRNRERVFKFVCLLLFFGVFIFAARWVAGISQQLFVWVSLGLLVLALVVLGAKDLIKKYLPPGS